MARRVPGGLDFRVQAVVESVKQGDDLRRYARNVAAINSDFGGTLISAPETGRKVIQAGDGLTLTILGPHQAELDNLEAKWHESKSSKPTPETVAADYLNRTVPNLSSIVILAEMEAADGQQPQRMLLTGDAGGDLILDGLEAAGLLDNGGIHVNLLKVQHHGSRHSVTQDFFERVTADHYVISGNGKHGNPHKLTLEWLSAAREGQPYNVYLTNRAGDEGLTEALDEFLKAEESQPVHRYQFRGESEPSITVDLLAARAQS